MIRRKISRAALNSVAAAAAFLCCVRPVFAGPGEAAGADSLSGLKNAAEANSAEKIIESYTDDFREDPTAGEPALTFGVRVRGFGTWTISLDEDGAVGLEPGSPSDPTFLYTTDLGTLRAMNRGDLAVFTAMGKASSSDFAPMDFELMEGYQPPEDFMEVFVPFTFHFWTKGVPEMVRFGEEKYTRVVHGANVVALYYQKGLRSAWYQIEKGQHINEPVEDQTNPFPTLVIFTRGKADARIGGKKISIEEGRSVLIPAGVSHEFWNESDIPAEFIIIMFGEGA